MLEIVLIFLVLALASVIRTSAGFGFSLVSVPPLALILDPVTAVTTAVIMAAPLSIWIAAKDWRHIDRRITLTAVLCAAAGVPIGIAVLTLLNERTLTIAIAAVVLACTALVWSKVKIRGGLPVIAGVSLFSGASFASTGIDGPPMVAAMQGVGLEPRVQRATLAVVFSCTSLGSLVGFGTTGHLTMEVGKALLIGIPAFATGIVVGERLFKRFDATRFRQVVLGLLIVSSVSILTSVFST